MKYVLFLIKLLILHLGVNSQTPCDSGRYASNVFSNVSVTSDIQYGQNNDASGNPVNLLLDFYEPTGDTAALRPLIIWAHGGSFILGTKTDPDMVALSTDFSEKGFACASIDYRLGVAPVDSINAIKATFRAMQDMKAAIRFFYQDRANANLYKIDTSKIFIGGASAGAITATHVEYLDKICEAESFITQAELLALGGLEGNSGNPGFSTSVAGVINFSGALASYGFMESGDAPICQTHGNYDSVVPYNRDLVTVGGFDLIYLDGSRMIHEQAGSIGVFSHFYTFYGAGHVPYAVAPEYLDTTINFVRDFLVEIIGCTVAPLQPPNTPLETAYLYPLNYCGLDFTDITKEQKILIYPNPVLDDFNIRFDEIGKRGITIADLRGTVLYRIETYESEVKIEIPELSKGTYLVTIQYEDGNVTSHPLIKY